MTDLLAEVVPAPDTAMRRTCQTCGTLGLAIITVLPLDESPQLHWCSFDCARTQGFPFTGTLPAFQPDMFG